MASIGAAEGPTGGEKMDRGVGNDTLAETMESCDSMEIRHYRRGWWQEFFCCQTKSKFEYKIGKKIVARSKEDFSFPCRCLFGPCHPFDMTIYNAESEEDFLEINRPFRCCMGTGKCVCNQEATIFSGEEHMGDIQESCWWFVPEFRVFDPSEKGVYIVRPPTCCFDGCVNCCPGGEDPCCPFGFCMIPCEVYAMENGFQGKLVGKMAKIPKKTFKECYNEINYYKVDFPDNATTDQKGLLLGSSILINALYFEHSE